MNWWQLGVADALLSIWFIVSFVIGYSMPATLLFLPKRKVKGGTKVVGVLATALLWPLFIIALLVSLLYELTRSVKKGKMKW